MIVICLESKRGAAATQRNAGELYEVVVIVFLIAYVSLISSYILITRQSCLKAVWRIACFRVCVLWWKVAEQLFPSRTLTVTAAATLLLKAPVNENFSPPRDTAAASAQKVRLNVFV